jgi:glycine/D-amino acid oxidase-like deaminating enzyme
VTRERVDVVVIGSGFGGSVAANRLALAGKRVGDAVELHLPAETAFGPHDPNLTFTDDLANVPPEFRRPLGERRLLLLSPFDAKTSRATQETAARQFPKCRRTKSGKNSASQ